MKTKYLNAIQNGKYLLLLLFFILLFSSAQLPQSTPDFSGTWIIDLPKSDFGDSPQYTAPKKLKFSQTKESITIERLVISVSGADSTMNETLSLRGQPFEMHTADKRTRHYTIAWTDNDQVLKEEYSSSYSGEPEKEQYNTIENWSLTADGKEVILNKHVKVDSGYEYSVKAVYDKQ